MMLTNLLSGQKLRSGSARSCEGHAGLQVFQNVGISGIACEVIDFVRVGFCIKELLDWLLSKN